MHGNHVYKTTTPLHIYSEPLEQSVPIIVGGVFVLSVTLDSYVVRIIHKDTTYTCAFDSAYLQLGC